MLMQINAVLTLSYQRSPGLVPNLQPTLVFRLHTNVFVNGTWIVQRHSLLSYQYGDFIDLQAHSPTLDIPAYLFYCKTSAALPADRASLAGLTLLSNAVVVHKLCSQLCSVWREDQDLH